MSVYRTIGSLVLKSEAHCVIIRINYDSCNLKVHHYANQMQLEEITMLINVYISHDSLKC